MVGHDGIEPSTPRLKGGCSTPELMAHFGWGGRIRTCACQLQRLVPYRLATPQLARPTGLEPVAFRSEVCCSIQLSYGRRCLHTNSITWGE